MRNERFFLIVGAFFGFLAVAIGAFAAHALRDRYTGEQLARFETGVRYQMYHALALVAVALASRAWPLLDFAPAGWSFVAGIVVFSGTLYLIDITGVRMLGAVTPLGGLMLLAGWLLLAWEARKIL